jgi:hypothetical protein
MMEFAPYFFEEEVDRAQDFWHGSFQQVASPYRGMYLVPFNWIFLTYDRLPIESQKLIKCVLLRSLT